MMMTPADAPSHTSPAAEPWRGRDPGVGWAMQIRSPTPNERTNERAKPSKRAAVLRPTDSLPARLFSTVTNTPSSSPSSTARRVKQRRTRQSASPPARKGQDKQTASRRESPAYKCSPSHHALGNPPPLIRPMAGIDSGRLFPVERQCCSRHGRGRGCLLRPAARLARDAAIHEAE